MPAPRCGTAEAAPSPERLAGPGGLCKERLAASEQGTEKDTETEGWGQMVRREDDTKGDNETDGKQRHRDILRAQLPQARPTYLTSRIFFSVTSTWITMG